MESHLLRNINWKNGNKENVEQVKHCYAKVDNLINFNKTLWFESVLKNFVCTVLLSFLQCKRVGNEAFTLWQSLVRIGIMYAMKHEILIAKRH